MNRGFEKISQEQWNKDCKNGYQKYYDNVIIPQRKTSHSAGYDFFSPFDFTLGAGEDIKVPTGIKSYMEEDEFLSIYPRSSLAFKYYLRLANNVAVIDCDYYNNKDNDGHIFIKIKNEGLSEINITMGMSFAQGIFQKYYLIDGDNYNGDQRIGGIGSTT